MIKIYPRGNEKIGVALKRFRKICEKDGILRELRKHSYYEKPSERKRRKRRKMIRRARQLLNQANKDQKPRK